MRQQSFENFGDEAFRTNLSHLHNALLPEAADEDTVRKSRDALVMNKHHPFAKSLTLFVVGIEVMEACSKTLLRRATERRLARELTDVGAVAEQVRLALTSYKIKLSAGSKWPHISKLETCHRMIAQCEGTATPYFARTHENTLSSIRSVLKTWHALLFQAVDDILRKALDLVAKLLNATSRALGATS